MRPIQLWLALFALFATGSCRDGEPATPTAGGAPGATEGRWSVALAAGSLPGSLPRLVPEGPAGPGAPATRGVRLAWVTSETRDRVQHAVLHTARLAAADAVHAGGIDWSDERPVAAGDDWFVNWADCPGVAALDGERLAAWFLQRAGEATYAYHAMFTRSRDGGATWDPPARLHDDTLPGEHGFVSLAVVPQRASFAAVWLDGRETAAARGLPDGHADAGPMGLRLREFDAGSGGALGPELSLDARVCDCCPTAAVVAGGDLWIAYRDRGEDETRDVAVLRVDAGRALGPDTRVERAFESDDGWRIAGCPVNGPALAARSGAVALAWFTLGVDARPRVRVAFLGDSAAGDPVPREAGPRDADAWTLAEGDAVLGRVDCAFLADGTLAVSWLAEPGDRSGKAVWRVACVDPHAGPLPEPPTDVATVPAGRASGIARIARYGDGLLVAHTLPAQEGGARWQLLRLAPR